MLSALLLSPACVSVYSSVLGLVCHRVEQSETVEVRIMQFSRYSIAPSILIPLVGLCGINFIQKFLRVPSIGCQTWEGRGKQAIYMNLQDFIILAHINHNKKAQLSLTNPRDAKACQELLQCQLFAQLFYCRSGYNESARAPKRSAH